MLGKRCLACGAPGDQTDSFCWQCGLKCGERPAERPAEEAPKEDVLVALKRKALDLGLLKETSV